MKTLQEINAENVVKIGGFTVHWISEFQRENDSFGTIGEARLYNGIVRGVIFDNTTGQVVEA